MSVHPSLGDMKMTLKLGLLELDSFAGWVDMGVSYSVYYVCSTEFFLSPPGALSLVGIHCKLSPATWQKTKKVKFQRKKTGFCIGRG